VPAKSTSSSVSNTAAVGTSDAVEKSVEWPGVTLGADAAPDVVQAVQRALGVEETGVVDHATIDATRIVQVKHNLPNTGFVDKATWDKLM